MLLYSIQLNMRPTVKQITQEIELSAGGNGQAAVTLLMSGHFGTRTLRHQDSSAPNNWYRSVR